MKNRQKKHGARSREFAVALREITEWILDDHRKMEQEGMSAEDFLDHMEAHIEDLKAAYEDHGVCIRPPKP